MNRNISRNLSNIRNENYETIDKEVKDSQRYPYTINRSSQYLQSSQFFSECRNSIKKHEYDILIDTLKLFNKNEITKNEVLERIGKILESYPKLSRDFRNIFLK